MTRAAAAALALAASAAAADERAAALGNMDAMLECRARAIAHRQLAEPDAPSLPLAAAIEEQANFVMILGFWGDGLTSVDAATDDMVLGERVLIENAQRVTAYARNWRDAETSARGLTACVPLVWARTKGVIDAVLQRDATRAR